MLGRLAIKLLFKRIALRKYLTRILALNSILFISLLILLKNINKPSHFNLYYSLLSM
jgi:preprotein translocase subunit SecG